MKQSSNKGEASAAATGSAKEGPVTRQVRGIQSWVGSIKAHPIKGVLLAIVLFAVGIFAGEVAEQTVDAFQGPDEYLVQIKDEQKKQFEALQANLGELKSSLSGAGSEAFADVRDAVDAITDTNSKLIQQLALAKRENQTLAKVAKQKAGISGGYDFILTENSGLRIDPQTTVGLDGVRSGIVWINLTSADRERTETYDLSAGEAVSYASAAGEACRLTLLTSNDARIGTASFAKHCEPVS